MTALGQLCAIVVMAKAPRAGKVKTRLVPPLTCDEAAALSASFLRDITESITCAAALAPVRPFVAYAPAGQEVFFDGLLAPQTGLVLADGAREMPPNVQGFGRCLLHAAEALFAREYGSVCLLNSDSPTLPTSILCQAAEVLSAPGDRIVLGPAEDGGYYLLGMKALHGHLFEDIRWSTEHVAAETRDRAKALGLDVVTLSPWYDVDDPASLGRLIDELSDAKTASGNAMTRYPAPATAACVARLGFAARIATPVKRPLVTEGARKTVS